VLAAPERRRTILMGLFCAAFSRRSAA